MATQTDTKQARGTKRTCTACEARFYDLNRAPILCPGCGEQHVPVTRREREAAARSSYSMMRQAPAAVIPDAIASEVPAELIAELKDEPVDAEADALPADDLLLEEAEEELGEAEGLIEPEVAAEEESP